MNLGPIIIIEDDEGDKALLEEVFAGLDYRNELIFFEDGQDALDFLNATGKNLSPFLILSDINMPKVNGFELREKIKTDAELNLRCIPYIFFSTAVSQQALIDAYSASVQGFFVKQNNFEKLEKTIIVIMEYWTMCEAPNRHE